MPELIRANFLYPITRDSISINEIKSLSNEIWDKFMSYNLNDALINAANEGSFKMFFFMTSMSNVIDKEFNKHNWSYSYKESYKKDLYTRLVIKAETELTKAGFRVSVHVPENEDNSKAEIEASWLDAKNYNEKD